MGRGMITADGKVLLLRHERVKLCVGVHRARRGTGGGGDRERLEESESLPQSGRLASEAGEWQSPRHLLASAGSGIKRAMARLTSPDRVRLSQVSDSPCTHSSVLLLRAMASSSPTLVSSPGKVLLAGGYLVLDPAYSGLVVSTSSRFYTLIDAISAPPSASEGPIQIRVRSPQFLDATWLYFVEFDGPDVVRVEQVADK